MPKNKTQGIVFGLIMSYSMAIGMEIYNNAIQQGVHLQPGGFTNLTYGIVGKALAEALFMGLIVILVSAQSWRARCVIRKRTTRFSAALCGRAALCWSCVRPCL